jgi:hypothetical protein
MKTARQVRAALREAEAVRPTSRKRVGRSERGSYQMSEGEG